MSERGWFRCHRGEQGLELLKASPHAFALLYIIAHRARWHDGFNQHGLSLGDAFVGDFESYGMSEQNYRTAKVQLAKWGFATFKPTNKGTVARIINTGIFDASPLPANGQGSGQVTDASRAGNGRVTTNKEGNNDTRGGEEHAVQLPKGFPATESDAAKQAAFAGCTEDFARLEWNQAAARGGKDYGGNPIASFHHYLSARAAKERGRQGEAKANGRSTKPKGSVPDHSKGFFEGTGL